MSEIRWKSSNELRDWLLVRGVDADQWESGRHKSIDNLWAEIEAGESWIEQGNPPVRLLEVVHLIIRRNGRRLVEARQEFASGSSRERGGPPSEKLHPGESYLQAARRCLVEELGVDPGTATFHHSSYRQRIDQRDSPSYPGLPSRYSRHFIEVVVPGLPDSDFSTVEQATGPGDPVSRHYWVWQWHPVRASGG